MVINEKIFNNLDDCEAIAWFGLPRPEDQDFWIKTQTGYIIFYQQHEPLRLPNSENVQF